jgi:hypothetical protein
MVISMMDFGDGNEIRKPPRLFFFLGVRLELILLGAAFWADPIIGKILEQCSGLNAIVGIAKFRVIYIATYCALPFNYHIPPFLKPKILLNNG